MRRLGYGDDGSLGDMREVRRWAGVSGVDKEGSGDHEIIPVFWGVSFGDRGSQRGSEDVCDYASILAGIDYRVCVEPSLSV